jgi:hypothetical protein
VGDRRCTALTGRGNDCSTPPTPGLLGVDWRVTEGSGIQVRSRAAAEMACEDVNASQETVVSDGGPCRPGNAA